MIRTVVPIPNSLEKQNQILHLTWQMICFSTFLPEIPPALSINTPYNDQTKLVNKKTMYESFPFVAEPAGTIARENYLQ